MPSNTVLDAGTGGDTVVTKERTHDGDASKQQGVFLSGVSGSEGSYTFVDVDAGGGVEAAALRVTIASDSTGVLSVDDNGTTISIDDGGGVITVDGTVAVTNAGLTELAAAINASSQMDVNIAASNATVTVDLGANNDVTVTGTVDLGATDNAVLDAIAASLALLDNSIASGNELQVDIVAALPAGANAIGTVTAVGAAAEDAAASGNPVLVGGRYDSSARTLETGDAGAIALNASGQVLVEIAAGAGSGGTAAADDADFTAGTTSGTPVMGVYESTPTSVTDGDLGTVGITANRELKVNVSSGGVSGIVDDAAFTAGTSEGVLMMGVASADTVDANDAGAIAMTTARAMHVAVQNSVTVDLGANNDVTVTGTVDLGATDNAVLDAIAASLALLDNSIATGNELQVDVVAALPAGTNNIGDVDVLSIAAGTNTIGNAGLVGRTTGGLTIFRSIDLDESEEEVKATAGQVFSITAFNLRTSPLYLKFYNATAANVTVGTTAPVLTFVLPSQGDANGAGFVWNNEIGLAFGTAITVAATTGVADNDTGAPGANECVVNIGYV